MKYLSYLLLKLIIKTWVLYLTWYTIYTFAHRARKALNSRFAQCPPFTISSPTVKCVTSSAFCSSQTPCQPALVVLGRHKGADFPFLQHSSTTHSRTRNVWFFAMTHYIRQTIFAKNMYAITEHYSLTRRILFHTNPTFEVFCVRNYCLLFQLHQFCINI